MKSPIFINNDAVRMIAHRGLSGIETENTVAAFVAAGNRGYYGAETDIYRTADGKFLCNHDGQTGRICNSNLVIEQSRFDELRALVLNDPDGTPRADLRLCTPEEYLSVCKTYGMCCVPELKSDFSEEEIKQIIEVFRDYLECTVFISFIESNLDKIKKLLPEQRCQLLICLWDDSVPKIMQQKKMGIDMQSQLLTPERAESLKQHGVEINCWTVDDPAEAERLIRLGCNYITTNILR